MIATAAAATAVVAALAAKITAGGGVVEFAELTAAKELIEKFGLTGYDVIITVYDMTVRAEARLQALKEKKAADGSV